MQETPCSSRTGNTVNAQGSIDTDSRPKNVFGTNGRPATDYFSVLSDHYRPGQREAIEQIENAFEQGYQFVLLEAPTGIGKSHIGLCFAGQSGNAHYLTIAKILQDQIEREFAVCVMKGRSAYKCLDFETDSCNDGPCRRSKKYPRHADCPYILAKIEAMQAPITVHNFDSFYYQNMYAGSFQERKLLVIDECHNIEGKYAGFMSFTLSSKMGFEIPEYTRLSQYDELVKRVHRELDLEYDVLEKMQVTGTLTKAQVIRLDELLRLVRRMDRYLLNRERDQPTEYIFDWKDFGGYQSIQFKPVLIGDYAKRSLFGYGGHVLMMSATILSKRIFCENVGLRERDVCFIQLPSYFPPEHRKIMKKYAGNMKYSDINQTLPKLVKVIEYILSKHPDRKGIIQTHSEKVANYIKDHLHDPRLTFNKDYRTPYDMLEAHALKPRSIIVASGLREGLDLRGDLSKIQIFCKIPYPSLGDKWVKRRSELDKEWYGYMTTLMFVQGLGRSVRSATEKAITYILDAGFDDYYRRNRRFIPGYIKEAIVTSGGIGGQ